MPGKSWSAADWIASRTCGDSSVVACASRPISTILAVAASIMPGGIIGGAGGIGSVPATGTAPSGMVPAPAKLAIDASNCSRGKAASSSSDIARTCSAVIGGGLWEVSAFNPFIDLLRHGFPTSKSRITHACLTLDIKPVD